MLTHPSTEAAVEVVERISPGYKIYTAAKTLPGKISQVLKVVTYRWFLSPKPKRVRRNLQVHVVKLSSSLPYHR